MSSYQTSRPSVKAMSAPVRLTTTTFSTLGQLFSASSALALSGTMRPPRTPSSAVIMMFESQSLMRPASESGEKPPNTTEWIAPIRAQASMATAISGIIGK
jgi:hypothetical protein